MSILAEASEKTLKIGNTVKLGGTKDYYVLANEQNAAEKYGYKGANQLSESYLLENDKCVAPPPDSLCSPVFEVPVQ